MRHLSWLRRRRHALAGARVRSEREVARRYSSHLDPQNLDLPDFVRPIDRVMAAYWRVIRRWI